MHARGEQSVSAGRDIGLAITGDNNHVSLAPRVRSAYWEQVRRIAPAELLGRERELCELAEFCQQDDDPGLAYGWWRAGAWAGKTALLSWFALHPPPKVRIVPFFVTARSRAQNDVVAYADVVLEQLAELAGDSIPAHLTEATRDAHLLRMYGQAARVCEERGERLVLLVDGLDEDRGVTTGPAAHSIAGILPSRPEFGLRVIVSGRLNPPLPSDVSHDHPIRDQRNLRQLTPSPYAQAIRAEAERELKACLAESSVARDLLGFVVAAEGGLAVSDLADLSGESPYHVQDILRTRAGRTFAMREASPEGSSGHGVYLLAHEEIQEQATEILGAAVIDSYRQLIHRWCDEYRRRSWPPHTPDYLLRGYFQMLQAHRDVDRLAVCAADHDRHERLLYFSGSDALALAEIDVASRLIIDEGGERLQDMLRISIHRSALEERISKVTPAIPVAWVRIGERRRGEELARSFPGRAERVLALAGVGERLAGAEAVKVLDEAEGVARQETDEATRDRLLLRIVVALVRTEQFARARELAMDLVDPKVTSAVAHQIIDTMVKAGEIAQVQAMAEILGIAEEAPIHMAGALAELARLSEAESIARNAVEPAVRKRALFRLAGICHRMKHEDRAGSLVRDALAIRSYMSDEDLVRELAAAGEVAAALDVVNSVILDDWRSELVSRVVGEIAGYGDIGQARALLRLLPDGPQLSVGAAAVAVTLCRAGEIDTAFRVARLVTEDENLSRVLLEISLAMIRGGQVEEPLKIARLLAKEDGSVDALVRVSVELAEGASPDRAREVLLGAEELARRTVSTRARVRDVCVIARALAEAGLVDEARLLLEEAGRGLGATLDRWVLGQPERGELEVPLVRALAGAGLLSRAESLARGAGDPRSQERMWAEIAESMIGFRRFDDAERVARIPLKLSRSRLPALVAVALAAAGDFDRAVGLARGHTEPQHDAWALSEIVYHLWAAGRFSEAKEYLAEAVALAKMPSTRAAAGLVRALILAGDTETARIQLGQAEVIVESGRATGEEVSDLVRAMVALGAFSRAESLVDRVFGPSAQAAARADLVEAYVRHGELGRAESLAQRITSGKDAARAYLTLARAAKPSKARTHVALALHHGRWPDCLPALLSIDPTMATIAIDALRNTHRPDRQEQTALTDTAGAPSRDDR
ncbi:hypothetical protein ACWD4G_25410 [Streptomyces sp. NPDC002643]